MLRSTKDLHGCTVAASDGDIGTVEQIYFDDEAWGVRYLVVDTGSWIDERRVLISPYSIKHADPGAGSMQVNLTRKQVKDSPNIDTQKPVSRQHEAEYLRYYGFPQYWGGTSAWMMGSYPGLGLVRGAPGMASELRAQLDLYGDKPPGDVHLRSTKAVEGYHMAAADGSIGHVSGFIYDDVEWTIRYLTVDTQNWWPGGKEVLLATQWIDVIDWYDSTVSTRLTRDAIKASPAYDRSVPIERSYEAALHESYGKDGYWLPVEPAPLAVSASDTAP
jgi:hypothetical protein